MSVSLRCDSTGGSFEVAVPDADGQGPTLLPNPASAQVVVDFGHVPTGLYFVRVVWPDGVAVRRLVVAR